MLIIAGIRLEVRWEAKAAVVLHPQVSSDRDAVCDFSIQPGCLVEDGTLGCLSETWQLAC